MRSSPNYLFNKLNILFLLIIILMFSSCNQAKDDEIKIGLSMGSLVLDRWQKDRDILIKTIEEKGGEVSIKYAHDNPELQNKQIRELVDMGMDVIIIIPDSKDTLTKALKYARKKRVKIIAYDRMIVDAPVDLYISFNTVKVGELIAESMLNEVKQGKFLIINGPKSDENSFNYHEGIKNKLLPFIENGQIEIVEDIWAKDWRETSSYNEINRLLSEGKKFDAVIAGNDILAEGAITALIESNKLLPVVGHDADLSACQRIVEGTQRATVFKDFLRLASFVGVTAVNIAEGKQIYSNATINNGKYDVPAYLINDRMSIIDKQNIDSRIIRMDVYKREDVYLDKF